MNVRYKVLTSSFDRSKFWETVSDGTSDLKISDALKLGRHGAAPALLGASLFKGGSALGALITGYANTPRKVEGEERTGSLDTCRLLLREGKLLPTDLVDAGGGWQTFAECRHFEDVCYEIIDAQRAKARRKKLLIGGAVALLVGAVVSLIKLM